MSVIPENVRVVVDTDHIRMKRPDFIRAQRSDLDAVIALYREAGNGLRPELAAALPSYDTVERDVEDGFLWYTLKDGVMTAACALTPEPVFRLEWQVEERDEKLGRFPRENWFRPGKDYISVLRQAALPGPYSRWSVGEITLLASMLARKCGIHETRTRNIRDAMPVSQVLSTYGFRLVGACRDTGDLLWYGFTRCDGAARRDDYSQSYRPLREEYNGDGYHRYDYVREVEDIVAAKRASADAKAGKKEDLMEDI